MASTHTKEELAGWLVDYIEHLSTGPTFDLETDCTQRAMNLPGLHRRVKIFLFRLNRFAVPLADALDPNHDRLQARLGVYYLVKAWASTLVGWDAPASEYIEGGFDVLMRYVIDQLQVNQ